MRMGKFLRQNTAFSKTCTRWRGEFGIFGKVGLATIRVLFLEGKLSQLCTCVILKNTKYLFYIFLYLAFSANFLVLDVKS